MAHCGEYMHTVQLFMELTFDRWCAKKLERGAFLRERTRTLKNPIHHFGLKYLRHESIVCPHKFSHCAELWFYTKLLKARITLGWLSGQELGQMTKTQEMTCKWLSMFWSVIFSVKNPFKNVKLKLRYCDGQLLHVNIIHKFCLCQYQVQRGIHFLPAPSYHSALYNGFFFYSSATLSNLALAKMHYNQLQGCLFVVLKNPFNHLKSNQFWSLMHLFAAMFQIQILSKLA